MEIFEVEGSRLFCMRSSNFTINLFYTKEEYLSPNFDIYKTIKGNDGVVMEGGLK